MDGGDPDVPTHKRPRLDSVNPVYPNGLPPPAPPHQPHPHSQRHPQASSPPSRHYPPHSLPLPNHPYPPPGPSPGPGRYQPHQSSPSLPPSDIRAFSDPRNLPSPGHRTHGGTAPLVTLPARPSPIVQDSIADYSRPTPTSRSAAPESQSSQSTSVDVKPHPGMEHGSHQAQWPVNPDHRPNGNFPNGYPPVASPPVPHEQQFHTPPIPQGQHYGQPPVGVYPASYMGSPVGQYPGQQRRKQVRATQACNHCRARKQKCDEARPCQFCRENNFDCQYKDVPPPKQDRTMMQLQESVNSLSDQQKGLIDTIQSFLSGFEHWKGSVESRLLSNRAVDPMAMTSNHASPDQSYDMRGSLSDQSGSRMPTPIQGRNQMRRVGSMKTESPIVPHSTMSPLPAHSLTPIKQEAILAAPQPPATPAESVRTDHTNQTADYGKERTGLKSDHTTPAHLLMEKWSSMAGFHKGVRQLERLEEKGYKISDYVMHLEQNRGLIRVWGVGEGIDPNDGAPSPATPEEPDIDAPSPAPVKEGLWGPLDQSSPSTLSASTPQDSGMPEKNPGGLAPDGSLRIDPATVDSLYTSYIKNIHNLHPFLNPSKLKSMMRDFADMYGSSRSRNLHAGVKRKRSASNYPDAFSPGGGTVNEVIEKSLRNAIVLLVLALGKVAAYKHKLPSPDQDKSFLRDSVWGSAHGSPYSTNNSFSGDSGTTSWQRNIDILPGMAYFSYATDILGNHVGGNTVAHAQANLLAALYVAQYARVLESWSWINCACRICLVLIKADMPKINRQVLMNDDQQTPRPQYPPSEEYRLNLVKCVYWTCLQLESDILAEMSTLPPSEISKHQDEIAYPTGVFEKLPDRETFEMTDHDADMWLYSSQIHLRVILNGAHNTLYNSDDDGARKKNGNLDTRNLQDVAKTARVHADILLSWRKMLPPRLAWSDDDPPATDINIARLRAKFYGGHYMILRPFLHLAVHELDFPPDFPLHSRSHGNSPAANGESAATPTNMHRHPRGIMDLTTDQSGVLSVAAQCVNSAIQSTIAFDRVGADPNTPYRKYVYESQPRFTLTSVFGTLHAQFGNMLVLAAVHQSRLGTRYLHHYTDKLTKENLTLLFDRTIKVLEAFKYNSPVLKLDMEILQNVRRIVGL